MSSKFKLQIRCVAEASCTRNNNVLGDKGVINYSSSNTTSRLEQRGNRRFSQETHSFKHQTLSYAASEDEWDFKRLQQYDWSCDLAFKPHHMQTDVLQSCFSFYTRGEFILKGIVHPKMNICWQCTHPQAIQDEDEFVSSWEQIWRNVALHHLLTNGSSAVNGCRQNESPNRW